MNHTETRPGDTIEVSGRRVGDPGRAGEILEVLGAEDNPHYLVRWQDGHQSVLYPGESTTVLATAIRERGPKPTLDVAASTRLLVDLLRASQIEFELIPHRRTTRASGEAHVLGVLEQTVAKTVIASDDEGRCVRAVVPASQHVDLARVESVTGVKSLRLLKEYELVGVYPQFELGAVPPFGGPAGDVVVIDRRIAECVNVVFDAGLHDTSLRMRAEDLIRISDAQLADIAAES